MRATTLALVVSVVHFGIATLHAAPELKGSPEELAGYLKAVPGQVTLSASAEIKEDANQAVLRLRVTTKDKLFQQALDKNRKVRNDIVKNLAEHGIKKDSISVSKFTSTSNYGWFSSKESSKPASYEVQSHVEIQAANEDEVQLVAGLLDSQSEVALESLTFEDSRKEELRDKAIATALDKLSVRKKMYEDKLIVVLRPRNVPNTEIASAGGRKYLAGEANVTMSTSTAPVPYSRADITQFDQLIYQAQVTVTYDVLPK